VGLAVNVMREWSFISVEEALLMLSGTFAHSAVRARAIQVLENDATDGEIYTYLIQLAHCM
jgi:hypothetical protein